MIRILFLLLISFSSFAQPGRFFAVNSRAASEALLPDSEIDEITVTYKNDQRNDTPISVTAETTENITFWKWVVYESATRTLVDISFDKNPSFFITDALRFYDIKLTATNSVDTYTKRWDRAWYRLPEVHRRGSRHSNRRIEL